MNRLTIIGNLTKDPEHRTTPGGKEVCNFTVAVNRRKTQSNPNPEADFFRVSAWNELASVCTRYLAKGRKVCVIGAVSVRAYSQTDGSPAATMEVIAQEIEFLTPRGEDEKREGLTPVQPEDNPFEKDLPF